MTFQRDPNFGHDVWLNDATRPGPDQIKASTAAALKTGADGFEIPILPTNTDVLMSYVDNFGGYPALVKRFVSTGKLLVSITIFGNAARCADVESGAMHASDLPHWLDHVALRDNGQLPWVYTSASNMSTCNAFIGRRKVIRWSAHFGFGPHVCGPKTCGWPQADWTQWTDHGPNGENYDRSVGFSVPVAPPAPKPQPKPKPVDTHHYDWYLGSEVALVKRYDTLRALPKLTVAQTAEMVGLRLRCYIAALGIWTRVHAWPKADWTSWHRDFRCNQLVKRGQGQKV